MPRIRLAALLAFVLGTPVQAAVQGSSQFSIDLSKPADASAKASWSEPATNTVTAQRLGWGAAADQGSRDFWLQSTEPLALGLSWRPTMSTNLRVRVYGPGVNGQLYA